MEAQPVSSRLATTDTGESSTPESQSPDPGTGGASSSKPPARWPYALLPAGLATACLVVVGIVFTFLRSSETLDAVPMMLDDPSVTVGGLGAAPAPPPAMDDADVSEETWTRPAWANYMVGVTAFELQADSAVQVLTQRFWPTIGVSCTAGTTEVYILTSGVARIEPETADHIVRITLDGKLEPEQRWLPAVDYQAMFAPDPIAVARQIVNASTLRLEFAHYLSGEVVLDFDVRGSEEYVASVAQRCKWD